MDEINNNIDTSGNAENTTEDDRYSKYISAPASDETEVREADESGMNEPAAPVNPMPVNPAPYVYAQVQQPADGVNPGYTGMPQQSYQLPPGYIPAVPVYAPADRMNGGYSYGSGGYPYVQVQQGAYANTGFVSEPAQPEVKVKKKRKMPGAIKVILAAVLFGLVAAAVFIGANLLYSKLFPETSGAADAGAISGTQVSRVQSGASTADAVASTDVVTDIDLTVTDVSKVVDAAMPSIVSINCTFNMQSLFGYYQTSGAGSGIILKQSDTELLIATNNHVVENALSINVTFADGTEIEAIAKGTDAAADLAVIAVSLEDIPKETMDAIRIAKLGDSDAIKVGQMVVAIGNAMGYGQSTTVGYISAKDREVSVEGKDMTLLQTDAAINPGNSGGALLNINGEVIGINSVKYASDEVEGMGFAIPISRATAILDNLASREVLKDEEKGYLGLYPQDVTSAVAEAYNWPIGVYVSELVEGGAADEAGIQVGDIITAIDGVSVTTSTDLRNNITSHRAGTVVKITLQRMTGGRFEELEIDVTLQTNPNPAE